MMNYTLPYKYYIPAEGDKVNNIEVKLYYDLGGMNYFTGRAEDRGYYLSVTPVYREDRGGFVTESTTAFTGIKVLLVPVKRQSKKAADEAFAMMTTRADTLVEFVCRGQGITLKGE